MKHSATTKYDDRMKNVNSNLQFLVGNDKLQQESQNVLKLAHIIIVNIVNNHILEQSC